MPPPLLRRLLLDAILPPSCAACGLPGPPVCAACHAGLVPLPSPACARCGHPAPVPLERCARCPAWLARTRQAVAYDGPAPALVGALKDGRPSLAAPLAALMVERVPRPRAGAVLVPVPLGRRRLAERGYNQSLLLARRLSAAWDLDIAPALVRVREAGDQRGAGARERAQRTRDAFASSSRPPPHGVLVDDVLTTGATLAACARALRAGGCRRIEAVAVARAIDRRGAALTALAGRG